MTNREHFIATLQACYFGDRNAFEEIIRMYDEKENIIKEVREILCDLEQEIFDGTRSNYIHKALKVIDKENK